MIPFPLGPEHLAVQFLVQAIAVGDLAVKRRLVRIDVLMHERGEAPLQVHHCPGMFEAHGAHDSLFSMEQDARAIRAGEQFDWARLVAWLRERLPACAVPGLDVAGERHPGAGPHDFRLYLIGKGRAGTPTAGWQYDYQLMPDPMWLQGVGQVPTLVGTTLRAVPHNGEPAGVTASKR